MSSGKSQSSHNAIKKDSLSESKIQEIVSNKKSMPNKLKRGNQEK